MPTPTRSSNVRQVPWDASGTTKFQPAGRLLPLRLNDLLPLRTLLSLLVGDEPNDLCPVLTVNERWTTKQSKTISG
jgi:hypothetical protein